MESTTKPRRRHRRKLTLADFGPSPVARRTWKLVAQIYSALDPFVRPTIRALVAASLGRIIRWLPFITQRLTFDLNSAVITFKDLPGTQITTDKIHFQMSLGFSKLGNAADVPPPPESRRPAVMYSMSAWQSYFSSSLRRSWDRAWGRAEGTATVNIQITEVAGYAPSSSGDKEGLKFFAFPGSIDFRGSLKFNPRTASIEKHSLRTSLLIDELYIALDVCYDLWNSYKRVFRNSCEPQDEGDSDPISPLSDSIAASVPLSATSSLFSPMSPHSPFFDVIPTSMRGKRYRGHKVSKLSDATTLSPLSILFGAELGITTVRLIAQRQSHLPHTAYESLVHGVKLGAKIHDSTTRSLYSSWVGIRRPSDQLQADCYCFRVSTERISVDRYARGSHLRVLSLASVQLATLVTQWPMPLLHPSRFMAGDPNAAFLGVEVKFGSLQITEHLEFIHEVLETRRDSANVVPTAQRRPSGPSQSQYRIPRINIEFHAGPICGRIICGISPLNDAPRALEFRTEGITASASSSFSLQPSTKSKTDSTYCLPVQMNLGFSVALSSILLRVRSPDRSGSSSSGNSFSISDPAFLEDPALLSLDTVEFSGHIQASGDLNDDIENIAGINPDSVVMDSHIFSDTLAVELWHPAVLAVIGQLVPPSPRNHTPKPAVTGPSPLAHLRSGFVASIALPRIVVYVTAPDLNRRDGLDLSRGCVLRTGLRVHYCCLSPGHTRYFGDISKASQTRQKLYLPELHHAEAISRSRARQDSQTSPALLNLSLIALSVRSAVTTPYASDDPFIIERDDPSLLVHEFLRVKKVDVRIRLVEGRNLSPTPGPPQCEVSLLVPDIRLTFQLVHVYSILLASRTIGRLANGNNRRRPVPGSPAPFVREPSIQLLLVVELASFQVLWNLNKQKAITRIDALVMRLPASGPISASFSRLRINVALPPDPQDKGPHWAALATLKQWSISVPSLDERPLRLSVIGDNGHLRIPSGFILSDLVLDINVTMKTVKHLLRIVHSGIFVKIPTPEAELAKDIPNITIRLRCLCLEAADDPFESKLAVICKAGLDASRSRQERERAFALKVAAIHNGDSSEPPSASENEVSNEYKFNSSHTIPIDDARQRLDQLHAFDWTFRHRATKEMRSTAEERIRRHVRGRPSPPERFIYPDIVEVPPHTLDPPLFRLLLNDLSLDIAPPKFPVASLPDFLHDNGAGLPRDTLFYLLVPMHLLLRLTTLRIWLRDYPLPLVDICNLASEKEPAFTFESDLVIAEETGSSASVEWVDCPVIERNQGIEGAAPLSVSVPKTLMPVKTYANPDIHVSTANVATFSWAVSYGPVLQDVTRIIDTISSPPRDSSPALGFWDKLRLIFHWKIRTTFKGGVHLYMKGLRDPYELAGEGAGFVLSWQGHTKLLIGHANSNNEIVQVISDSMVIAVPSQVILRDLARLGPDLQNGAPSYRFQKTPGDSYNGFRSDFIHFSLSLASAVRPLHHHGPEIHHPPSSFHLTPKVFAHFWSWLALFDGVLSLPIRQGTLYPRRHISPKFGRHLATLKYWIAIPRLFVLHAYMDESRETWVDGVTPFVGIKAMIDEVQIDMHQRDQETITQGRNPQTTKASRHKSFYAAEVVLKGLDLRTVLATFDEPLKQAVPVTCPPQRSNYRSRRLPAVDPASSWLDDDDFIELDWIPCTRPTVHLLPILSCPRFNYCKRQPSPQSNRIQRSKFGDESSHTCMLGKEPSSAKIQVDIALARIAELKKRCCMSELSDNFVVEHDRAATQRMIKLLEDYVNHLQEHNSSSMDEAYLFPSDNATPEEWEMFDNVYQIHCPKIFLSSAIRDIMLQYYYCSRSRRGYEYHLATRAVRYILDQAEAIHAKQNDEKPKSPFQSSQAAASALRKILSGDTPKTSVEVSDLPSADNVDPLHGWSDGVSLMKSHFFLLLKPQIVLRSEKELGSVLILAAVQAKLQLFHIMDKSNVDDPVSGKVMSRSYGAVSGLQTFAPVAGLHHSDGCVPLEVLVDVRCESDEFDRIVPQTDATFHYDKFNRLRLRNNVTAITRTNNKDSPLITDHLHNQTDLIQFNIPRFTVIASDEHFQTISDIITNVILFSDATQKSRLDKLETLLFTYDFSDLLSAAGVVSDVQSRLRNAVEVEQLALAQTSPRDTGAELWKLKAHIYLLSEELTYLFDAIKMAQDRVDDLNDQRSALLLRASSSEISWRMLDENKGLLAKLALRNINFKWLSRRDSSTVNSLDLADLQAFDGARNAMWTEILCKYDEPANHPLLKRGLFLLGHWTVLAPVGGITIYEDFELSLHPIRLQIDASLGRRIMEYLWPARKDRRIRSSTSSADTDDETNIPRIIATRASLDSPRALQTFPSEVTSDATLRPPMGLRRLGSSRSFTDLRFSTTQEPAPKLSRTRSSDALKPTNQVEPKRRDTIMDATEMKTRSSQKSFVLVRISSLHILLSIKKDDAFECREARIRTRDLEYRNQTWSFEELVDQFIPSDMSWRGWVKMALHQPLVPVLPVARELISKTKWINAKSQNATSSSSRPESSKRRSRSKKRSPSPHRRWQKLSKKRPETPPATYQLTPLTDEPESMNTTVERASRPETRPKVFNLFSRKSSRPRKSSDNAHATTHHQPNDSLNVSNDEPIDHDGQESIASTSHGAPSQGGSAASYTSRPRYLSVQGEEDVGLAARTPPVTGRRRAGTVLSITTSNQDSSLFPDDDETHHHDDIVEHLDVIDPQVGTVSSLTNAANSIVFPPLSFYSRKPVVYLPTHHAQPTSSRPASIHSDSLDRHVEDIITGIYGFLVVFWGAALVLILGKAINFHNDNTQGFWVEVCSQIMNGLFTVTGIGLIPFRVMDSYRIFKIWHYKLRTKRLRAKAGLPQLLDRDDLPDPEYDPNYVHVLTDKQQHDLHRQQVKFHQSQTWYRAHGTETHRAFPINTALLICLLNDGNSIFQIMLCATMWGLNRFQRPAWSTGILIPASFLCGIFSGVFIWRGGAKTKRTQKVEEMLRAALEQVHTQGRAAATLAPPLNEYMNEYHTPPSHDPEKPETSVDEEMVIHSPEPAIHKEQV
ncbi:hypothetical protein EYR38_005710 [Pleurotus pulmonarius]|nr:hypothetical protein EYR38_005710 [Pleurotus pulmonarius]